MKKADLHTHSRVSDGSFTIRELAQKAAQNGLDAIAVTDHDTLSQLSQIPADLPVQVIGGIEISAMDYDTNQRAHILGYRIQNVEMVEEFVHPLLEARNRNTLRQVEILRENGFSIDPDKLCKADGKYLYKQHVMEYLVETGQAPDMFGDFYKKTFKNGGICAFDITYLNPFEAVRVIREAGGLAVLAHSGQQKNFSLIPPLVDCGLNGLEIHHPAHSALDRAIIREYAERFHLFLTGGSDFHGKYEPDSPEIGAFLAEESGADAICWA